MNYGKEQTQRKRRALDSKKGKIGRKLMTVFLQLLLVTLFGTLVSVGCGGYGIYRGILDSAPSIEDIDATPTGYLSTVLDADGNVTATLVASGSNRIYVTIDEIPENLQNAFIAIEDSRFLEHNGIDLKGIARAGFIGITSGNFSEGASTITQQLLKNNVFTGWTNETSLVDKFKRKIQEQYLAIELERVQSKEWILENYLNTVNLGQNTLGVQSASMRYFNKDVSELTLSECAVIAGITKNPSRYNPISHPEDNAKRRQKVLDDMLDQHLISKEAHDEALSDSVYSRIQAVNLQKTEDASEVRSYFVDALTEQVIQDLMEQKGYNQAEAYKALYNGGLTIYSTQDPTLQAICDDEINNLSNYPGSPKTSFSYTLTVQKADGTFSYYDEQTMLSYYRARNADYTINFSSQEEAKAAVERYKQDLLEEGDTVPEDGETISFTVQPQAALTLMDQKNGQVKAIVGGRGEKLANRTLNRATDSTRQPGSTFKILAAFAPALDTGQKTLASVEDDAPYTYSNKTPVHNYDNRYRGFTTIREAITHSINIVTVKTLSDIGVDTGYEYLTKHFGFTTLSNSDRYEPLALGGITNGVTNLELTAAYASLANSGTYIKPRFYTKITDHEGNVLIDNQPQTTEAVKPSTAWLLTNAMQDVMTQGTGTPANFDGMTLAGKSGTTTKNKDALFAGYSPYFTCVVWGGYDDNTPQNAGTTSYPKLIWRSVMRRVHEGLADKEFAKPSDIVTAEVCKKSGNLILDGLCTNDPRGSMAYTEYFALGTAPKDTCDHHSSARVCAVSGMAAGPYCPVRSTGVRIVGGSPDSEDGPYLFKGSVSSVCTIHTAPSPEPDDNGTAADDADPDGHSDEQTDGHSGESEQSEPDDSSGVEVTIPQEEDFEENDFVIDINE